MAYGLIKKERYIFHNEKQITTINSNDENRPICCPDFYDLLSRSQAECHPSGIHRVPISSVRCDRMKMTMIMTAVVDPKVSRNMEKTDETHDFTSEILEKTSHLREEL